MSQTTVHNRGSGAGGALGLGHNPPPGSGSNMSAPPVSWSQVLNTASGGSGTSNAQNASATTTHQQQQEVAKASAAGSPQNSNHSGSTLKEHDLLGLSDVSSSSCKEKSSQESLNDEGNESEELNLNLGATELRLGPPAARKRASAIEQQGTPALESGSFLVALDGSQGAKQCVVAAEKSTTTAEQNAAASEHSDRGFNYAPGGRANEMSLLASQGSRMDAAGDNNTSCRPLIESESLMKWHPEQGGDRKAPTEGGLVLGISLLSEKKAFLNSIDRNRELTQEPKQQHERIFQEEESSTEKLQDRSVPSQEQQQQQVAPQQQQERSKLDSYQSSEKRNIIERKSMAPLQQPCPEQRFQSISERSPRMPDSSGRLWQNQVKMHTSNVPEFQSQHPSPQQDIDGRTGYSVPNGAFVVTRSVYVAPKPGVSGAKRNFDAITGSDSRNFSDPRSGLNGPSSAGGVSMNSSNGLSSEAEAKAIAQQQQQMKVQAGMQMYRGPKTLAPPTTWHIGLDQSGGSFGPFPSQRGPVRAPLSKSTSDVGTAAATDSKIWDGQPKSHQEAVPALSQKMPAPSEAKQISSDATPSPAESVSASTPRAAAPAPAAVGWPPLRSFRKNLVVAPRPTPSEAPPRPSAPAPGVGTTSVAGQSNSWFVKVYMDGVPIGRKVDLRTNSSYEKLSQQLDDMFRGFVNGQRDPNRLTLPSDHKRNFLQGSDYVLTYEDQDGDLMLVGDVPWGMFIDTVKRLRIMKGSEAIGLGTRASDKANKTQASV